MEIRPFSRFEWLMNNDLIRPFSTIQSPRFASKSPYNRHRNHLHIHQAVFGVDVGFPLEEGFFVGGTKTTTEKGFNQKLK
jgi:hypothetical protein